MQTIQEQYPIKFVIFNNGSEYVGNARHYNIDIRTDYEYAPSLLSIP